MGAISDVLSWVQKDAVLWRTHLGPFVRTAVGFSILGFLFAGLLVQSRLSSQAERLQQKDEQIKDREDQIKRLRIAAGLDDPGSGPLIPLTNAELKQKAMTTAKSLKAIDAELLTASDELILAKKRGLPEEEAEKRKREIWRNAVAKFQNSGLRADAVNVETELARRLGPKALVGIYFGVTMGDRWVSAGALMTEANDEMTASWIREMASGIDRMAQMLPMD